MQISQNNNQSFGINLIKFEDKASQELFNRKNRAISPKVMTKVMEEVKQMKPKNGPDIDVYIGRSYQDGLSTLTYRENSKDTIGKAFDKINAQYNHTSDSILNAFRRLVNKVDEYRA